MLTYFIHDNSRPGLFTVSCADQIFASVNRQTREVVTKREVTPEEATVIEGFLRLSCGKNRSVRSAAARV